MFDSLWPHGLQQARILCTPLSPGICSNICPLSWGCYLTVLSSVAPFSSCFQCFPALGSFPMSPLFVSGGQSIGASALASVLPEDIQGWFHLRLTGLISLKSKELSRVFSSTTVIVPLICCLLGYTLLFHFKRKKQFVYRKHHLPLCIQILFIISVIESPKQFASWGQQLFMFKFCVIVLTFFLWQVRSFQC